MFLIWIIFIDLLLAMVTFLPLGFFMGFVLYRNILAEDDMSDGTFKSVIFPFVIAICGSLLSTIIMVIVKLTFKKYVFEHLYIIMVGLLFFLSGSNKILSNSQGNL